MPSKETNALIAYQKASGVPAVVTSVDDGVHTPWDPAAGKYGAHFAPATDGRGLAVDFAHKRYDGKRDTPELLAIYRSFVGLAQQGLLSELYYAGPGADWCVWRGQYLRWVDVPKTSREAIRAIHHDHVHVAVRKGAIVKWSGPPLVQDVAGKSKTEEEEPDMATVREVIQELVPVSTCRWNDGAEAQLFANGDVYCYGAKSWGAMGDLRDDAKKNFKSAGSILPVDPADSQAGYIVLDKHEGDPNKGYKFDATARQFFK